MPPARILEAPRGLCYAPGMARKRLGELLVERRVITVAQLEDGLAHHRQTRQRLGASLVEKGHISEEELARVLSLALSIPLLDLKSLQPEWTAVHLLRARFCEQHEIFPFQLEQQKGRKLLYVAMADPLNIPALEEIEFTTGCKVSPYIVPRSQVRAAILQYYHKVAPGTGRIEVVHRGGKESVFLENKNEQRQRAGPIDFSEDEVITGEAVEEVTERTRLADLIGRREQQRKERRKKKGQAPANAGLAGDISYLFGLSDESTEVEDLERKFWALMRIMARKGLITKDEFQKELDDPEGSGEG